jgi:hypothetical protein
MRFDIVNPVLPKKTRSDEFRPPNWGQERRLEFIDFRLLWEGRINRAELVRFFGISIPQASLDISRYTELAPRNLEYDKSDKVYRKTSHFEPAITPAESQRFLNQLRAITTGALSPALSFIGWMPPCDIVQFPARLIRSDILIRVLWAMRDRNAIELTYQSMRQPGPTRRWISPHAIAFDGTRWHARAWCHETAMFRDFVLGRIQTVHRNRTSDIDPLTDLHWNTFVTVVLRPRHDLNKEQKRAVEADFGMKNGKVDISVRQALALYLVRQLQLDQQGRPSLSSQPIEWVNEREIRPLLEVTGR